MPRPVPPRRPRLRSAALPLLVSLAFPLSSFAQQPPAPIAVPAQQPPAPIAAPPAPAAAPTAVLPAPAAAPTPPVTPPASPPTAGDISAPAASVAGESEGVVSSRVAALAASAASPGSAHNLITRVAQEPMGKNNGVRLWLKGDASGAVLRVRLSTANAADTPGSEALRPVWVSSPVIVSWTGWRQIPLPKSKFTLQFPSLQAQFLNLALPADAQTPVTTSGTWTVPWSDINTLTLEMRVARRAALIVDDISWVTLDASGAVTNEDSVDDFEKGNVAAWVPGGPPADQKALLYGLATQPGQAHGGRVAFKLTVTSPAAAHQASLTSVRRVLAITGQSALVFTPTSLFDPVLPVTLPAKGGTTSQVSVQACPDQIQAATFCLYAPKTVSHVTVSVPGDLQAVGHVFSRGNVSVHVVQVRPQAGAGPLQDDATAGLSPALLVKDDRVALSGTAPAARLTGAPVTDIPADTTKQFWVTVTVPRGTPPGRYTGSLRVSGVGLAPALLVPMDVTVLPLRLLSPAKQYAINLRSRLDAPPASLPSDDGRDLVTDFVSKDTLDKQLADIYAHGVRIPTIYDSPATLPQAVAEYRQYGMGEPYLYRGSGEPLSVEAARKTTQAAPFVFGDDDTPLSVTGPRLSALTGDKLAASAFLTTPQDYDALQSVLGLAIYNRDSAYAQGLIRTRGLRTSSTRDWWYWPASTETPLTDRLDAGFLLWRANLYGAFLPAYQSAFGADPYDETSAGAPAFLSAYRPQMLTYPARDGVIDTLQWEAVREGITDVRYLTTMYAALRECKDAHIAQPLVAAAEAYARTFLEKPLAGLPETGLDTARAQIASYALQLRAAVDSYNKAHGIKP